MSIDSAKALKIGVLALLCLGVAYIYLLVLAPTLGSQVFTSHSDNREALMDFVPIYAGGTIAASPDRFNLYNAQVQFNWCKQVISPEHIAQPLYFQNPPYFATLLIPLALLPIKTAYIAWTLGCSAAALAALNWLLLKFSPQLGKLDRAIFLCATFASLPSALSLKLGQTSWLVLICFSVFAYAIATQKNRLAGTIIALSTFKPQYLPFFAFSVRKRSIFLTALIVEVLLLSMATLNVGVENIVGYPNWLFFVEANSLGTAGSSMANLRGLCAKIFPAAVVNAITVCGLLLSLLYLLRMWRFSWTEENVCWPLAVTIVFACFAGPHVHNHDLVIMAVAAALTLPCISVSAAAKLPGWQLRCWTLLFLYYPFVSWLCYSQNNFPIPIAFLNFAILVCGVVHIEQIKMDQRKSAVPAA